MTAPAKDGQYVLDADYLDVAIGNGTKWHVEEVVGLDVPAVRAVDQALVAFDGIAAGEDTLDAREVVISLGYDGELDDSDTDDAIAALARVMGPRTSAMTLDWQRFGRQRRLWVRPRGMILPWGDDFGLGAMRAALRLVAPDPVVYSLSSTTSASVTTSATITNGGNYPIWPTMEFRPTASTATIQNVTDDGEMLSLSGLTVGALYLFDFRARTVLVGGSSDAYSVVGYPPGWFRLLPGGNSIEVTGGTARFLYRDGWISG